jgi:hypothetical protein
MSLDIRRVVNSHKAIGHLRPDRDQRWVVLTYSLKDKPTTFYGLVNVLRSFPTQREAEEYAQRIRTVTTSTSVIARPACTWLKLTTEIDLEYREANKEVDEQLEADHERMSEENKIKYKQIIEQNAVDKLADIARNDPSGSPALRYYLYKLAKTKKELDDTVKHISELTAKYSEYYDSVSLLHSTVDYRGQDNDPLNESISIGNSLATEGCEPILLNKIILPSMRGVVRKVNGEEIPLSRKDSPFGSENTMSGVAKDVSAHSPVNCLPESGSLPCLSNSGVENGLQSPVLCLDSAKMDETSKLSVANSETENSKVNSGDSHDVSDSVEMENRQQVPNNSPICNEYFCEIPARDIVVSGGLSKESTPETHENDNAGEVYATDVPMVASGQTEVDVKGVPDKVKDEADRNHAVASDTVDIGTSNTTSYENKIEQEQETTHANEEESNQEAVIPKRDPIVEQVMDALMEERSTRRKKR